ncbi:MAG: PAS domain S-box protein [Deltaproteobacteria bacterium]|nr:PAS domain S-box protein [Deltaproteobacteria bacterium]
MNYRAIFENLGAATAVIGRDDVILLANRKFEKISGWGREEIEGKKKWTEFVVEEDRPRVRGCLWTREAAPGPPKDHCEFRFTDPSQNIRHYFAAITEIPFTDTAVMTLLDVTERKLAEEALRQRDRDLEMKSRSLEEANVAWKVLLDHQRENRASLEEQVLTNLKKLVIPSIENLKRLSLNDEQRMQLRVLERQLQEIAAPLFRNLSIAARDLTPRQMQVALLVKDGMTSKEIAKMLGISRASVDFHRTNLRAKLGIFKDAKKGLRSFIISSHP